MTIAINPVALTEPSGSSALTAGAFWVQHALLGTVATLIAVIAVATIGLLMMAGRIELRRGATVIAGCFILFGAPAIAAGIRQLAQSNSQSVPLQDIVPVAAPAPLPLEPPKGYDPYAGASVPRP